jgi:hypothetical protein
MVAAFVRVDFPGWRALIAVFAMISSLVQAITSAEWRPRDERPYNMAFRGGMPHRRAAGRRSGPHVHGASYT